MASNNDFEEKPNLRPTKHVDAGGKTIYLHHNPNHPSSKSYIHAVWQDADQIRNRTEDDPFGIQQPHIKYSLNKQRRWQNLNSFRQYIRNQSSSSSDDERETLSDGEQKPEKKSVRRRKKQSNTSSTKYRLYESHNISQRADCVSMTTNTGSTRVQLPRKTYMQIPADQRPNENNPTTNRNTSDVTYFAVVPPPKDKQLANVRKHANRAKKTTSHVQRSKFTDEKHRINAMDDCNENVDYSSTDEEDLIQYICSVPKPGQLSLNDFVQTVPSGGDFETTVIADNLVTIEPKFDPKSSKFYMEDLPISKRFHRQMSREEKLYKRDKAVYLERQKKQGKTVAPIEKSHHHLMNLSFRSVFINKTDLTIENLTKVFGKHFLHAQCYPTKYVLCLTDRLRSYKWLNQFDLFPIYSNLNSYLILILNDDDDTSSNDNYQRVQIGLNMDLFSDTVEIENLYESIESIYRIDDLVDKVIQFITTLPFDTFKPKDADLTRKSIVRDNVEDSELSDSEYLNKQIRHLQILDKKTANQTTEILEQEQLNSDVFIDDYDFIRPEICTICCRDTSEITSMTAIKACVHWFCNDCWKQYLESSIRSVKLVRCLEWNCESIVDVGTILSLVNVRCMNLYERNIEKCLVNLSRSFIKCPNKTCMKIIQVIGSNIDHVRCGCGELFCINCKKEAHFPATCNAYQYYINEVYRNGDMISDAQAITHVQGRNCISCNNFIEKNGGCNHMTCRCGAEFCWSCTAYWKDHYATDGTFRCPKEKVALQEELLAKAKSTSRRFYLHAIFHRRERFFQRKTEHAKRLLGTIPLDKGIPLGSDLLQTQIDKREAMLKHFNEMSKYISYLHRICEFIAVSADGYGNNPSEFRNSLLSFETIVFNMSQVLEGGRGYKAIEQLKQLHETSEKFIQRLQRAVTLRELRRQTTLGYATS